MRTIRFFLIFPRAVLIVLLLTACTGYGKVSRDKYIAPIGDPPADTIIWSPQDTSKIVVSANGIGYGPAQVFTFDFSSEIKIILAETDYGQLRATGWSSDGKYIVVSIDGGTKEFSQPGIWLLNTEDNSLTFLINQTGYALWLPDGNYLGLLTVNLASASNSRHISFSLIDVNDKTQNVLYTNEDAITFLGASMSPDGQNTVFSLQMRNSESDLYVLNLITKKASQLTHDGQSAFPAWSPQGDFIAYQRTYNNTKGKLITSLYLTKPEGGCTYEIPGLDYALSPAWSPDGTKIAYIGSNGIYVFDFEKFRSEINNVIC